MAKFVKFMLNNGNAEIEQMEIPESTPAAKLGLKTGYGKGITVDFLNYKFPFYGHDGAGLGFNSRYAYNKDLKVGFVICCSNPNLLSDLLINYFTDSLQIPKPIPTLSVSIESLKSYEILKRKLYDHFFDGQPLNICNQNFTDSYNQPYSLLNNLKFVMGNDRKY